MIPYSLNPAAWNDEFRIGTHQLQGLADDYRAIFTDPRDAAGWARQGYTPDEALVHLAAGVTDPAAASALDAAAGKAAADRGGATIVYLDDSWGDD